MCMCIYIYMLSIDYLLPTAESTARYCCIVSFPIDLDMPFINNLLK